MQTLYRSTTIFSKICLRQFLFTQKSPEATNSIQEIVIYLQFIIPSQFSPKEPSEPYKKIIKNLTDLLIRSYSQIYRYARLIQLLNFINHILFQKVDDEPSKDNQRLVQQASARFSAKQANNMLNFLCPFFLQQYARYFIISKKFRSVRAFFQTTIQASALYIKKDNLTIYALAGYIIASKYYDQKHMHTWGLINYAVFYNLGIMYQNSGFETDKISDSMIKAINYSNPSKDSTKDSIKLAESILKEHLSKAFAQQKAQVTKSMTNEVDLLSMDYPE